MENCIFCKITTGEIPHNKVYENANFVGFLDINPINKGHTLLIPKKHLRWIEDADDATISGIFMLSKKIILAMKKGLNCDYVQVMTVGKDVPHFHVHLIPRNLADELPLEQTQKYTEGEAQEVVQKITSAL